MTANDARAREHGGGASQPFPSGSATNPEDAVSGDALSSDAVVGIDESASAWSALVWAASYARATAARLRAVHVLEVPEARDLYADAVVATYLYTDGAAVGGSSER
jgi:hypothetical protein